MAMGSGLCSSIGYGVETVPGTYTAPTRHIEHVKEGLKLSKTYLVSKGLRGCSEFDPAPIEAGRSVAGSVEHELAPQATGILFKHLLGAVTTTGTGPYTHVFTAGDLVEETMTVQIAKPSTDGVANPFTYLGMQIVGAKISSKAGDIVQSSWDFAGMDERSSVTTPVGPVLVAPVYPASYVPFTFVHGSLQLAGSEFEFDSVDLDFKNSLRTGHMVHKATQSGTPALAVRNGKREFGGSLSRDFMSMTAYGMFVNGTIADFNLLFTAGAAAQLKVEGSVFFDGDTPTVDGPDILKQSLPFRFVKTSSFPTAVKVTLINGDSAP